MITLKQTFNLLKKLEDTLPFPTQTELSIDSIGNNLIIKTKFKKYGNYHYYFELIHYNQIYHEKTMDEEFIENYSKRVIDFYNNLNIMSVKDLIYLQ